MPRGASVKAGAVPAQRVSARVEPGTSETPSAVRAWDPRAAAARLDAHVDVLAAARGLRRWLPGDGRFGDSLSTAGGTPVALLARSIAGSTNAPGSAGELGLAGLQVWQAAMGGGRSEREMALLFTGLPGFSAWALHAGDTAVLALLRTIGSVVEGAVGAHRGSVVKRLGDGLLASFPDARSAVDAALAAQTAMVKIRVDGFRPRIRAGVHWGRPLQLGGDVHGIDVNIAARVAQAAHGGQVLVSGAALGQIGVDDLRIGQPKRLNAAGVPGDLRVTLVRGAASGQRAVSAPDQQPQK